MNKLTKENNPPLTTNQKARKPFCINKHNAALFPYKEHAYEVYKTRFKGLNTKYLTTIFKDYEIMLSHFCKVFVFRIDLHPRVASSSNQVINNFLACLIAELAPHYGAKIIYHCAREQSTSDKEHYHLELLLDGNKINYHSKLQSTIKALWETQTQGSVAFVDNPFCIVERGNKASLRDAIYRSSYLAKEHTKELNHGIKSFISNKIAPSTRFDLTTDILLVEPEKTYQKNKVKQYVNQQKQVSFKLKKRDRNLKKYGWINQFSHALLLKELVSTRCNRLNHIINIRDILQANVLTEKSHLLTSSRQNEGVYPLINSTL